MWKLAITIWNSVAVVTGSENDDRPRSFQDIDQGEHHLTLQIYVEHSDVDTAALGHCLAGCLHRGNRTDDEGAARREIVSNGCCKNSVVFDHKHAPSRQNVGRLVLLGGFGSAMH